MLVEIFLIWMKPNYNLAVPTEHLGSSHHYLLWLLFACPTNAVPSFSPEIRWTLTCLSYLCNCDEPEALLYSSPSNKLGSLCSQISVLLSASGLFGRTQLPALFTLPRPTTSSHTLQPHPKKLLVVLTPYDFKNFSSDLCSLDLL